MLLLTNKRVRSILFLAILQFLATQLAAFSPSFIARSPRTCILRSQYTTAPLQSSTDSVPQEQDAPPSIESMRVKEIQAELKERDVPFTDCFDKESLVKRLKEARENNLQKSAKKDQQEKSTDRSASANNNNPSQTSATSTNPQSSPRKDFDRNAKLEELRGMRIRELKEECGKRRIRWAQFVEKEDFVQALIKAAESAANFSVSGCMQPGEVADLTDNQLEQELSQFSDAPLLLDVYATWCGPCQMMAPQLKEAAVELGDRVRVGKIDSDKYPGWARKLKAGGLPTVLLLNGDEELQRMEGALMKDQILKFVDPYL